MVKKQDKTVLPERITVSIERTSEGLWAEVKEVPNCYTQAGSLVELIEMVNDAIYTYFDIPDKKRKEIGYYVPLPKNHLKWEEVLHRWLKVEKKKKSSEVFQLTQEVIC